MVGFTEDEIVTGEPTRSARLKWVIAVLDSVEPGIQANAVACVSAATAAGVSGLLGPDAVDAARATHPGLPWAGCTVLVADQDVLSALWAKGLDHPEIWVADMPVAAQTTRIYDEYRDRLSRSASIDRLAVSLVGPRNAIDRMVKRLSLR